MTDRILRPKEVAELCNVKTETVTRWRLRGIGPRFSQMSAKTFRYKESDVLAWIEEQSKMPTHGRGVVGGGVRPSTPPGQGELLDLMDPPA